MRRVAHWQVPLALAAASLFAAIADAAGRQWLRYDREPIADGEIWRLLTGHIAHLNRGHLVLNLAGLALVWVLVGSRFTAVRWWLVVLFSIAVIDAGFWFLDPVLTWYVGLSGLLHALLLAGVVDRLRSAPTESIVLLVVVSAKIAYEQFAGPLPGSETSTGGPVVVNAHLYGAVAGILAGLTTLAARRATAPDA